MTNMNDIAEQRVIEKVEHASEVLHSTREAEAEAIELQRSAMLEAHEFGLSNVRIAKHARMTEAGVRRSIKIAKGEYVVDKGPKVSTSDELPNVEVE